MSNLGATRFLIGDKGNNSWWDQDITAKVAYDLTPTVTRELRLYQDYLRV